MSEKEFNRYVERMLKSVAPANTVSHSEIKHFGISIAKQVMDREEFASVPVEDLAALIASVAKVIMHDNCFDLPVLDREVQTVGLSVN